MTTKKLQRMFKSLTFLVIFATSFIFPQARSVTPTEVKSFKPQTNQTAKSCPYTVIIRTSCSSPSFTRDKISLAFGDAYRNEVYAKKLDDVHSRIFERCSADTFQINGPCTYDICYRYLLRRGSDGWKPESVKIYRPFTKTVTFYFDTSLPNRVWFGFNECRGGGGGGGSVSATI